MVIKYNSLWIIYILSQQPDGQLQKQHKLRALSNIQTEYSEY